MPTIIRVKEQGLEIVKSRGITNISINTLWVEKGIAVTDVIANFNQAISNEAEARDAAITAEAQLRIAEDLVLSSYITNLNSTFSTNIANLETELQVMTGPNSALAQSITALEVRTEDVEVTLSEQAGVFAGYFSTWDGLSTPKIGQLKFESGITYQYVNNNWVRYDEGALGVADKVKGWVAGSSSLVVDPITGLVTGWQYGDGSGFDSFFRISAENIELSGSTTFNEYAKITYVDTQVNSAIIAAQNAQDTADSKIVTFYQPEQPTNASEGDIWFDIDNGNKLYTYRSGIWTQTQDSGIALAINSAQTAQTIADGKAVVYYQTSAPTGLSSLDKGDIWIDVDDNNRLYIWSGSAWVVGLSDLAKLDMSNVTTIDGGKITTGTIYNAGGNSTNYTMKIDLNAGEIHIK